jgi:hypothetical protein
MHAGRSHPLWVDMASWIFAVATYALNRCDRRDSASAAPAEAHLGRGGAWNRRERSARSVSVESPGYRSASQIRATTTSSCEAAKMMNDGRRRPR